MQQTVAVSTQIPAAASLPQAMAATSNNGTVPGTQIGFLSELEKLLTAATDTTPAGMSPAVGTGQSSATPRWLPPAMQTKPPAAATDTPVTASAANAEPPADGTAQPSSAQPPQAVAILPGPALPAARTPRDAVPGTSARDASPARRSTPKHADTAETAIQLPAPTTPEAAPASVPAVADGPSPASCPRPEADDFVPTQAANTGHAPPAPPFVGRQEAAKPAAPFDAPAPAPVVDTPVATSVAPSHAAAEPTLPILAPAPGPPTPRPEPADTPTPASIPTAAHGASPAAQLAPALVQMGHAPDGATRLTVRLDPPELGHVEVRIERPPEAPARVEITVEKAETLTLLLRDQPQLQRALDQAGVPPEGRSVTFHVAPPDAAPRSEPATAPAPGVAAGGPSNDGSHGAPRNGGQRRRQAGGTDADGIELTAVAQPGWVRGGIDITA